MDFKPLVTLLAVVNPLAIVPFFIHYTQGFTRAQRRRTVVTAAFSAFVVIASSALLGLQILEFFSISLASFQVGGGMLLLTSALNMLNAKPAEAKPAAVPAKPADKPKPPDKKTKDTGHLEFMDVWYPVQVKQKDKAGRPDIDAFEAMMTRADRTKGFFVSFDYSKDALTEIDAFFRKNLKPGE